MLETMDSSEPRRGGRPPNPDGRIPPTTIRLEPAQRRQVEAAALPADKTFSDTLRRLLMGAARDWVLTDDDMAVVLAALADANRYHQLRWSLCHQCRPQKLCERHAKGDPTARSYRELLARLGGDSGE